MCTPGARSPSANTGTLLEVAVHTISASRMPETSATPDRDPQRLPHLGGKLERRLPVGVENQGLADRPYATHGLELASRLDAGADDRSDDCTRRGPKASVATPEPAPVRIAVRTSPSITASGLSGVRIEDRHQSVDGRHPTVRDCRAPPSPTLSPSLLWAERWTGMNSAAPSLGSGSDVRSGTSAVPCDKAT